MSPDQYGGLAASLVVILGAITAWYARGRPKWRRFWARLNGTLDAITGREGYVDPASGRNIPALLPLTTRVANVEEAIIRLTRFEERMLAIEKRVEVLEDARVERVVTQAESAQMWRAVADRDLDKPDE